MSNEEAVKSKNIFKKKVLDPPTGYRSQPMVVQMCVLHFFCVASVHTCVKVRTCPFNMVVSVRGVAC